MKKKIDKENLEIFMIGFSKGKKNIIDKILKFVEEESRFIPDIHSDALLDRLVKFVKKI